MNRADWNRRYADPELVWSAEPNRFLVAETQSLPPGRALDLACGEGRNAIWLARRGWRVLGVDFAEHALAKARRRLEELEPEVAGRVELVHADLLDWTPEPEGFDLVLVLYLQLPADERRRVLANGAAALAPGGTLLLVCHDLENLTRGHGGPKDASVLMTADQVTAELRELEIERAGQVLRHVAGADRPAIDVLVRARAAAAGSG